MAMLSTRSLKTRSMLITSMLDAISLGDGGAIEGTGLGEG